MSRVRWKPHLPFVFLSFGLGVRIALLSLLLSFCFRCHTPEENKSKYVYDYYDEQHSDIRAHACFFRKNAFAQCF